MGIVKRKWDSYLDLVHAVLGKIISLQMALFQAFKPAKSIGKGLRSRLSYTYEY